MARVFYLVGEHEQVVFVRKLEDSGDVLVCEHLASRVARIL